MDRKAQLLMGTVFTTMGLGTMLFPKFAIETSFSPQYLGKEGVTPPVALITRCFGSQATLCGLLILSSNFSADTFRNFGLAMIPYFVFDFHYWNVGALTIFGALGDAVGNAIFAGCCYVGYTALKKK